MEDKSGEGEVVKDRAYHEAAIEYNEKLMDFAAALAPTIEHPVPRKWCLAVARQHRYHLTRHLRSLNRIKDLGEGAVMDSEDGGEDRVIDDEQIVNRSAKSGQFVTEDEAEENPDTTVTEHIDTPKAEGDVHYPFEVKDPAAPADSEPIEEGPDPTQAAEPVDAGGAPELSEEEARARYEAALAEAEASKAEKENNDE